MTRRNLFATVALAAATTVFGATGVGAQDVTPNFGTTVPGSWVTDRYAPTTFNLTNGTHGRDDVLNIGITSAGDLANRPSGYQYTFYNTQGMQMILGASPGSYSLTADLWVDATWRSNAGGNSVRTDMWGVAVLGGTPWIDPNPAPPDFSVPAYGPWDYPIIGFTNYAGTGLFRGYDVNTGVWNNFNNPVTYGAWNTLGISWDATTFLYSYYVNDALAGTVQGDGLAVGLNAIIMQAYNFNDPSLCSPADPNAPTQLNCSSDYTAQWSNTEVVPEPATMTLLATGLIGLAGAARRRKNSTKA